MSPRALIYLRFWGVLFSVCVTWPFACPRPPQHARFLWPALQHRNIEHVLCEDAVSPDRFHVQSTGLRALVCPSACFALHSCTSSLARTMARRRIVGLSRLGANKRLSNQLESTETLPPSRSSPPSSKAGSNRSQPYAFPARSTATLIPASQPCPYIMQILYRLPLVAAACSGNLARRTSTH